LNFTGHEKEIYESWLQELIDDTPNISKGEIETIWNFVVQSVKFLSNICENNLLPEIKYRGCMENIVFLIEYLYYYHIEYMKKEHLYHINHVMEELLSEHSENEKLREYYLRTGLTEKIQFCLEYYFGE